MLGKEFGNENPWPNGCIGPLVAILLSLSVWFFLLGPALGIWGTSSIFYKPAHMYRVAVVYNTGERDTIVIFSKDKEKIALSPYGSLRHGKEVIRSGVRQITVLQ